MWKNTNAPPVHGELSMTVSQGLSWGEYGNGISNGVLDGRLTSSLFQMMKNKPFKPNTANSFED